MNKKLKEMHKKLFLGENNPRWNGGVSKYPNHILLKKKRIEVLKKTKGKCEICGRPANLVHHIDGDKSNHSLNNLIPLCNQCHWPLHSKEYGNRNKTSKYIREYGMTLEQLGHRFNISGSCMHQWLKNPNTKNYIKNEIQKSIQLKTN